MDFHIAELVVHSVLKVYSNSSTIHVLAHGKKKSLLKSFTDLDIVVDDFE